MTPDPRDRAEKELDRLDRDLEAGLISRADYEADVREINREVGEWEREMDRREQWDHERGAW